MAKILISYRRQDTDYISGRIYDALRARFGPEQIIKDIDSIPLGVDFRHQIATFVEQSDMMLLIIGPQWLGAAAAIGQRRIDSPNDFVHFEVELALQRSIPIIPVLVQHAIIPDAESLPASIAAISYRNGIEVRPDPDFLHDMDRLMLSIEATLPGIQYQTPAQVAYPSMPYPPYQGQLSLKKPISPKKVVPIMSVNRAVPVAIGVSLLALVSTMLLSLLFVFGLDSNFDPNVGGVFVAIVSIPLAFLSGFLFKRLSGRNWGAITGFLSATGLGPIGLISGRLQFSVEALMTIAILYGLLLGIAPGGIGNWIATFF